jgi:ABC-2 type transport system ATP-binding protein
LETVLSIHNISKRYGRIHAVSELSIDVNRGQVFGILGPNGSGKTTTLSILLDLIRADKGTFKWFGEKPSKETRKRIGSVIEHPNFFPYLNAIRNLQIVADVKDMDYSDIPRVLHITSLYERRHSKFRTYSFGMKQRLAVASALLGNPEVLILDEPTNGLDPQGIAQIRELILNVAAGGITIILASHLLDEVQKICSHVAVLSKGRKLFSGKVSEVLSISDSYEMASSDLPRLIQVISTHHGYSNHIDSGGKIQVYFKEDTEAEELNAFCYSNGIILSHLSERKRSLEQHFLELLQNNS